MTEGAISLARVAVTIFLLPLFPLFVFAENPPKSSDSVGTEFSSKEPADTRVPSARTEAEEFELEVVEETPKVEPPEFFRYSPERFIAHFEFKGDLPACTLWEVSYPSPFLSPHPANNTVVAEYYKSKARTNSVRGAVIILHFLEGSMIVERPLAYTFAAKGVDALVLYMAYYGKRAGDGSVRMISEDFETTLQALRQTVMDVYRARNLLASMEGVDRDKIGLVGISLGAFVGEVAYLTGGGFDRAAFILGGADVGRILWEAEGGEHREKFLARGLDLEGLQQLLSPLEPLTYAPNAAKWGLRDRILMVNATNDEVVPKASVEKFWQALGKPEIMWVEATHVGSAAFIIPLFERVLGHFTAPIKSGSASLPQVR